MKYETPYSEHTALYWWPKHCLSQGSLSTTCHFFRRIYPPSRPWLIIHTAVQPFKMLKCQVDVTEALTEGKSAAIPPFHIKGLCATDTLRLKINLTLEDTVRCTIPNSRWSYEAFDDFAELSVDHGFCYFVFCGHRRTENVCVFNLCAQ